MSFFDTTPIGHLLNLFSKDMDERKFCITELLGEINCQLFPCYSGRTLTFND